MFKTSGSCPFPCGDDCCSGYSDHLDVSLCEVVNSEDGENDDGVDDDDDYDYDDDDDIDVDDGDDDDDVDDGCSGYSDHLDVSHCSPITIITIALGEVVDGDDDHFDDGANEKEYNDNSKDNDNDVNEENANQRR